MDTATIDIKALVRALLKQGIRLNVSDDRLIVGGNLQALDAETKASIRDHKRAIVAFIGERTRSAGAIIRSRPDPARAPLSFAQQRLWFIDQLEPGNRLYNMPMAFRLIGALDQAALQRALDTIVERHEVLRTVYRTLDDGEAVQVIDAPRPVPVERVDLSALPATTRDAELIRRVAEEAARPFDLGRDLMLRLVLIRTAQDAHVLGFTMHHIASDGWSVGVLTEEFIRLYSAYSQGKADPLDPLPVQYADFAHWQREWLSGALLQQHLDYWLDHLADLPQVHRLPLDRPRPATQSVAGDRHTQRLDRALAERLNALSLQHGATLFMTLQAAFAVLLARYSNETDIVIGTPIANRTQAELNPLIGCFINTLVLRNDLSGNPAFADLLQRCRQTALQAYEHQQVPFELLVDRLQPERSSAHGALYQIMFVLQNQQQGELRLPGLRLEPVDLTGAVAKYDLHLGIEEDADGLHAVWTYCTALFTAETIARMSRGFETLLAGIADAPETPILLLPLIDAEERHRLLVTWNDTTTPLADLRCVHERFEAQARTTPDVIAVRHAERVLSYAELERKANRLAHQLIDEGVEPGAVIGLHLERSLELMVALLAVLKVGAVYVPFDPRSSAARLSTIIDDAGIVLVLTQSTATARLPVAGVDLLDLDDATSIDWFADQPDHPPQRDRAPVSPSSAAYIIYTSGSTGLPKGVVISHASLTDYCACALERYYAPQLAGSLVVTSHAFDITVPALYLPLLAGGCVDLLPAEDELTALAERLSQDTASHLLRMTPLHAQALLGLLPDPRTFDARHVFVIGGAAFPAGLARQLQARFPHSRLVNHYGPTEATVGCAMFDVSAQLPELEDVVPIGRPLANTALYVLNRAMELAPVRAIGELYIGGAGVAQGYLNRDELTAEKFVANPFAHPGASRLYRSGDLVRWRADGYLEYLGRTDDQVKIRGFRVEPGEVEQVLLGVAEVAQAAVVARADGNCEQRLIAYLMAADGVDRDRLEAQVQRSIRDALPEYMQPSRVVVLDAFPLSANGKIDRRRLPAPELARGSDASPPATPTEAALAQIWAAVLAIPEPGCSTSFFELGGHSLLVTRLVSAINQRFSCALKIRDVFSHNTVRALAQLVDTVGRGRAIEIPPAPRDAPLPLSFAQQRLWFIEQYEPGTGVYNLPMAFRLHGRLNIGALQQALGSIVARHEVLRTVYRRDAADEVRQWIQPPQPIAINRHDLQSLDPAAREREVAALLAADLQRPFDLGGDPMLRLSLIRLADDEHVLLFNMHHIASDGWSMGVLTEEFVTLYAAFDAGRDDPLPALPLQYGDFAHWQRHWLQGEVLTQQLDYWRRQLADLPATHGLPLDRPRPANMSVAGALHAHPLDAGLGTRLHALALAHGATLFMTLQAAFAVLLSRYGNQHDIVMGTPIANRTQAELAPLIGFFVNTLVLRSDLSADPSFVELLAQARRTALDAFEHQHVPFEMLVSELQPSRSTALSPLFQIMFVLQNNAQVELSMPGLQVSALQPDHHTAKFDLTMTVVQSGDELLTRWEYCTDLFEHDSVVRLAECFEVLLAGIVDAPQRRISELPLQSEPQRDQVLALGRGRAASYPRALGIDEVFEQQVERRPDAIAVVEGDRHTSYQALDQQANRLAHHLSALGLPAGARVALVMPRSLELLVAQLAVIKLGCAYVPIDPDTPADRRRFMIADCAAAMVLTRGPLADLDGAAAAGAVVGPEHPPLIDLIAAAPAIAACPSERPAGSRNADLPAYVMYTSGSTGQPKGVVVPQYAITALAIDNGYAAIGPGDCIAHCNNPAFDASTFDVWVALLNGARVAIIAADDVLDAGAFARALMKQQATAMFLTTGLFAQYVDTLAPALARMRWVLVGGDVADPRALGRQLQHGGPEYLLNAYGPTETTTFATCYRIERQPEAGKPIPIGRPLSNTSLYILDRRLQPVPVGVPGEIYIGGSGVALGYLERPELTAERFLDDPWCIDSSVPARMYRTGDHGRWLADGNIEYLGRLDGQVKLRGFRIEPGEIEAQLTRCAQVREAAVLVREDTPGDRRLVAYLTCDDPAPSVESIRTELRAALPDYMVPSAVVVLDSMPLTVNGKLDRRALPAPGLDAFAVAAYEPPQGDIECALAQLWRGLLPVERVGRGDNFFELGGHSLLATRLVSAIEAGIGRQCSVRAVFEHASLARLATHLQAQPSCTLPAIVRLPRDGRRLPLSFAQQRLWLIDQLEPGSSQYNMPTTLRLRGTLDRSALQRALDGIVARHEVLRTVYRKAEDGEPEQCILPAVAVVIEWLSLEGLAADAQSQQVGELALAEAATPFDLSRDPMLRARLLCLGSDDHVLLFTMHHIASDGWSMGVLVEEFVALYAAFAADAGTPLPPLPLQYADFAHWQREWLDGERLTQQLAYWRGQLAGLPPLHALPTDRPRPVRQSATGGVHMRQLDRALADGLDRLGLALGATLFMTLQAAFALLLARYSGETDIVMGTPIANRTHAELSPLIGFFVNTLVLRSDLSNDPSFTAFLQQTRAMALEAYEHQHIPFEMLVAELQPERSFSHSPLFQVMFALQNAAQTELRMPGLALQAIESPHRVARFDLTLTVAETADGVLTCWEYCADLFDAATIEHMADSYAELLGSIVADPARPLSQLGAVPAGQLRQLAAWQQEGLRAWVLDPQQAPVPIGAIGELVLAIDPSDLPARPADDAATEAASAPSPRRRTGDRARYRGDGQLELVDRIDQPSRVRGYRIRTAEIARHIATHPQVSHALVTIAGDDRDGYLLAYVVPAAIDDGARAVLPATLRPWLQATLPAHLVPAACVVLDAFPTTPDGEVDLAELPQPTVAPQHCRPAYLAPRNEEERALVEIWQQLLGVDPVGVADNFFVLGGNSLTALRLEFAIQERFEVAVSIREIFQQPELAALAALVATRERRGAPIAIEPALRDGSPLPLSFAQQRLWFIDQLMPGGTQYNMPLALRLEGELDVHAVERAFGTIVERHEILRTVYATSADGHASQVILAAAPLVLEHRDLGDLHGDAQRHAVLAAVEQDAQTPFRLDLGPLLRVSLLKLAPREHVLLLNMHHIASDGWSIGVLTGEFLQLYAAYAGGRAPVLPPLPVQYVDYAVWQRSTLQGECLARQLDYWHSQLAELPPVHSLRLDRPRPLQPSHAGRAVVSHLDAALVARLQQLARVHDASMFMLLHAAFAALLARWSGEDDIVIGSPVAGRTHPQLAPLIGFFVNTLVLRSRIDGQRSFGEWLAESRRTVLDAFEHQLLPFEMLVERLCPQRNLNHAPLFQILFSLQEQCGADISLPGLAVSGIEREQSIAKFDLSVQVAEGADGHALEWSYNTDIFDQRSIAALAASYQQLLLAIVDDPQCALDRLPLAIAPDHLLERAPLPRPTNALYAGMCLHESFEHAARRWPERTALIFEQQRVSYRALNEGANRLARHLRDAGVRDGQLVGLFIERSLDMVEAILAILKAGAAYVPLDPSNPPARTEHMLADADVALVVTQRHLGDRLPTSNPVRLVCLDDDAERAAIARCSSADLPRGDTGVGESHAAYVIYTSGSTGKPKGVVVEHRQVMCLFESSAEHFRFDHEDCWTLFHSFAFDFSVWEIWGALLHGGRLVVVPYAVTRAASEFHRLLVEHEVTVLNQTPSAFYLLSDEVGAAADLRHLRYVVFGGEALDPLRLRRWIAQFGDEQPQLINMYGITETTVHVTYRRIRRADCDSASSVIGTPLRHLTGYVCNRAMALQPVGAPGELYVGGTGVARGYLNRPELTDQRFVEDPFSTAAERLYRTGDLVRWTHDGELEYLGRIDHQAKLRGFRIELGEIEFELAQSGLVKESVVLIHGHGGHQQLVAHVVPTTDPQDLPARLRKHLIGVLPAYMVPATFVVRDAIPLTENGKIDRKVLLGSSDGLVARAAFVAPTDAIEEALCRLWSDTLELQQVGTADNFFAIGGDSIRVVQLVKRAEAQGIRISVRDVFLHQTIGELADVCRGRGERTGDACAPAPLGLIDQRFDRAGWLAPEFEDCYPVTALQRRMLDLHGDQGSERAIFQPKVLYDVDGVALAPAVLETVLAHVIHKHPTLRTNFVRTDDGDYVQRVVKQVDFRLPVVDFSRLAGDAQRRAVERLVEDDAPFTLGEIGVRFRLLKYAKRRWGLFISTHHAVIDGWALVEIRNEVLALYPQVARGRRLDAADRLPNVFKEHLALELEAGGSLEHAQAWRALLEPHRPMPALPTIAEAELEAPSAVALTVAADTVGRLDAVARQHGVNLKVLLLLAYQRALCQWLDTAQVTVDVVTSGRSSRLSDPFTAVGLFWSLLPVCAGVDPRHDLSTAIADLAKRLLRTDAHALYPVDRIQALAGGEALTWAAFNYVNFHNAKAAGDDAGSGSNGVTVSIRHSSDRFPYAVKLAASSDRGSGEIVGSIEFDRGHFTTPQIAALIDALQTMLAEIAAISRESSAEPIELAAVS